MTGLLVITLCISQKDHCGRRKKREMGNKYCLVACVCPVPNQVESQSLRLLQL